MAHSSNRHARDIVLLSPAIASRRMQALSTASPASAVTMLSALTLEKSVAFFSAWMGAAVAISRWQMRCAMLIAGSNTASSLASAGPRIAFDASRDSETIARATLAPIARRVRSNSRQR